MSSEEQIKEKKSIIQYLVHKNEILAHKLVLEGEGQVEKNKPININFKELSIKYLLAIIILFTMLTFFEPAIKFSINFFSELIDFEKIPEYFKPINNTLFLNILLIYSVLLIALTKSIFNLVKVLNIRLSGKLSLSYIFILALIPIFSIFIFLSYLLNTSSLYSNYPNMSPVIVIVIVIVVIWLLNKTNLFYWFVGLVGKLANSYYHTNYFFSLLTILLFCFFFFSFLNSALFSTFLSLDYIKIVMSEQLSIERISFVGLSSFGLTLVLANKLIETYFDFGVDDYQKQLKRLAQYKEEKVFNDELIKEIESEINNFTMSYSYSNARQEN